MSTTRVGWQNSTVLGNDRLSQATVVSSNLLLNTVCYQLQAASSPLSQRPPADPSTHRKHLATYCRTGGRCTAWFSNERESPAQLTQMIHPHIKPVSERTTYLKPILLHHFPAKRPLETNTLSGTALWAELALLPAFDTADIPAITSTVPPGLGPQVGKQTEGCHHYLELYGSYSTFVEKDFEDLPVLQPPREVTAK